MTAMSGTTALPIDVPKGSILGLNYSGMHDTSIAIVGPDGEPLYAVSLERISRTKQDGRRLAPLLEGMPWERIEHVAISVSEEPQRDDVPPSVTHPLPLRRTQPADSEHGAAFREALAGLPCPVTHVAHHLSHAASAFWGSGLREAICLVYDGGMSNENVFGGLYDAAVGAGIATLDRYGAARQANVTHLYSAVTAALGFTPQKHEGKITGLAAYGRVDADCWDVMRQILQEGGELAGLFSWRHLYSAVEVPELVAEPGQLEHLRLRLSRFSREDTAATLQALTEDHIRQILQRVRGAGFGHKNICLSGGLFANVKVNQQVAALDFDEVHVSPAMTDDGTALGAAWHVHFQRQPSFQLPRQPTMYLGPCHDETTARATLDRLGVRHQQPGSPADEIAALLAQGDIVAVVRGAAEFGPRALCNRSILASAARRDINDTLNKRLNRTEFMPFAPVVREEDAPTCFELRPGILDACRRMTITVACTSRMAQDCPGVVHVDGTARPQLVDAASNSLAHAVLTRYAALTSRLALVNTSFNVHEEPIVCSVDDALRGFFEAGLDHLYIDGVGLISRQDNLDVENRFLRDKLETQTLRLKHHRSLAGPGRAAPHVVGTSVHVAGPALAPYLAEGFHEPEAWGAWSQGRHARLTVPLSGDGTVPLEVHVSLTLRAYEGVLADAPVLALHHDERLVGIVLFRPQGQREHDVSFHIRTQRRRFDIRFEFSHTGSPRWLGGEGAPDGRELGFGLQRLAIAAAPAPPDDAQSCAAPMVWGA